MNKEIEKKQIIDLKSVVDYAEGGIVKQELLHSETGSVTIIAFDAKQQFSKHTAPFEVLIQILDGEAEIMIEDNFFQLKAGEIIIIPKNAVHAVKAITRFKMLLTRI